MKELQAGIQLVRANGIQLNRHLGLKRTRTIRQSMSLPKQMGAKTRPPQDSESQKPPLSFPVRTSLAGIRQRTKEGLQRLESQAERINQLSDELEAAVFEFKAIASEIIPDWRAIQATHKSSTDQDVCEYQTVNIPIVQHKPSGSFKLTSRPVDLFKAEREATLLAQTLRHQARRKRNG